MDPFGQPPDPTTAFAPPNPAASPLAPEVGLTPTPPADGRSRRARIVGMLAAVVVLAVGGVIVAKNIESASGGFDSPEAAVNALFRAADQEDVLGAVDVMRPGERSMLRDTLLPVEQEMERLDVLAQHVDMRKLAGLQVSVEGITSTTDALSDRVAVVTLTGGTMTTNASFADLPLGKVLRDQIEPPTTSGPSTTKLSGTKVATVKEDGRWYVSLGYTIAESARTSAGKPVPDFAHPIASPGADSPEAAVTGLAGAISKLDLNGAIGMLAPGEFGALQDYGTLFVPDAQQALDRWKSDNNVTVDITEGTPTVERHGSTADVSFDTFTISAGWGSDSLKITMDAKHCATIASDIGGDPKTEHVCVGDGTTGTITVPDDVRVIIDRLKDLSLRVVAVQENGHWYVAPIRTVFDFAGQVIGAFKTTDDIKAVQKWLSSTITDAVSSTVSGSTDSGSIDTATTAVAAGDTVDPTLSPAFAAFDSVFRAHLQPNATIEETLQAMAADGSIPEGFEFLDSAGVAVAAGTFTDVIGVRTVDGGVTVCMILSEDASTPGFSVSCP